MELLYQIALTLVPNIGHVHARILAQHFGSASAVFSANIHQLEKVEGIGTVRAAAIRKFKDFAVAEKEIAFIKKFSIVPLFVLDKEYPQRLLHCYDAPTLLFFKGKADLNNSKVVAIVGTRNNSEYGRQITDKIIRDLSRYGILIVSGLAYGIDSIAHQAALKFGTPTVGVIGHGLDQVYPAAHSGLAKDMVRSDGGLLTEFRSNTQPDKHNFPGRNRIVAGMSDATIVIETGSKGGSLITADIANSYHRDVFAVPGRITDKKSEGCNHLIRENKAVLFSSTEHFIEAMRWNEPASQPARSTTLFHILDDEERIIAELLRTKEVMHVDELNLKSGLTPGKIANILLQLEINGLARKLPGKMYTILT